MLTGSLQSLLTTLIYVILHLMASNQQQSLIYYFQVKYMLDFNKAEIILKTILSAFTLGRYSFKGSIALKGERSG